MSTHVQPAVSTIPFVEPLPQWYAVQTKARHERKVESQLERSGIETFLPMIAENRRWSDRWKKVAFPLFPCYLFVRMRANWPELSTVLQTGGVLHILGRSSRYEPVPVEQIESIQKLVGSELEISSHRFLQSGDRVRIRGGALDGVTGVLEEIDNSKKLVVSVHLLAQSICVSLNGYELEKV